MGLLRWSSASFPVFLFAPSGVTAPSMREMLEKLRSLKAETVVITRRGEQRDWRAFHADDSAKEKAARVVYADSVHHSGATVRRVPGGAEGARSRPASHADQGDPHSLKRQRRAQPDHCRADPLLNDATASDPPSPMVSTADEGTITIEPFSLMASYSIFMARRWSATGLSL